MSEPDDEFFVGYLPTPPRLTRFSLTVAVAVVCFGASVAVAAAFLQSAPGDIEQGNVELTGRLVSTPYGMLRYLDEDTDQVRHVLLVRGGKFGAPADATARLAGQTVTVSGLLLTRDGQQLMELHRGITAAELPDAVEARLDAVADAPLGEVTVEGEIVDSKCFLGRMRPGGGRTHRACAQLCIAGNIPPVLVGRAPGGDPTYAVLASEGGGSVSRGVLPFVAEPVRVTGSLVRRADLFVLRIDPASGIARRGR
ncbi:MAG: hypothetical protein AB8I08_23365 [Sandaracinaceae bacterium]